MAPSVFLLYILFTLGFLSKRSVGASQLELGIFFVDEPQDVTGLKGKSLSIPCKTRTNRQKELFQIVWYHDDKEMDLRNDKRRIVLQNGTLHFSKLVHKRTGHSDQGEYRCVAVRENGSLSSKPGFLRISALPETFSRHPITQNVKSGSNVRLICQIEYRPDIEIDWEKDDRKIPENSEKYATISGPDIQGSILYIFNVGSDDSGNYRCTARNILSNKQRHSSGGLLTVLPQENGSDYRPLTFLSAQQSFPSFSTNVREIKEGDNVTMDCVTNDYSILVLGWTFLQYGHNTSRSLFNFTGAGYNIINLKNVTRNEAGWYTCTVMNLSGKNSRKLQIHLKVMIAPEIKEKSDSIAFRTSKTVRFRCIAHGNPIPEVYWLKDGNLFNITGRIKHRTSVNDSTQARFSELIVSSTVASDAGIYQCMAKNSVGLSWAASRLFLNATKPAPEAPEKVSCESMSSSKIKLTWDVSNTSSEIKAFSVHYHLTENGEEMQKVMPSDYRSVQIDKLLPFSNYTFYLRLYMDSASEFSEKAICQTGEEVPTDAPEKKLQIISQNSVLVSWSPLNREKARGVINKYKIQWRSTKSPSSRVVEVAGNVLNHTITGLIPGKKYDLRVLAATSKGWPDSDLPWETFEIPLNFNSSVPSPPEVILQALNSSEIEVRWRIPNKGTNVIGYKIFYRNQNGIKVGPIIVPADTNKQVIAGLEPDTLYEIMVLGFTEEDDGETGVSFAQTLSKTGTSNSSEFSSILEPPSSLEADPISPVAINLTWSPPRAPSGLNNVKYYIVCFNPVLTKRNQNAEINCVKSLENKISISGLNPYTLYEFKVKSHDLNDQESIFSQVMECHTLEDVPSQVLDINWKAINKTAIQVSWKEPWLLNGVLKSYILFYTEDSNLPLDFWSVKTVSASTRETQLTDLGSNMNYYLIIRAATGAGLGSYGAPKQISIPSKITSKYKRSDHYIGIAVGLGIGIFCIIICTTCILCRRRCLKREVSQEFEVTSCRPSASTVCQRERESRETEYFTFLSASREQPNTLEVTVRHLNTKDNYPNGSSNGISMSLLGESKISNESSGKANIYPNENSRYDKIVSGSPVSSTSSNRESNGRNSKLDGQNCHSEFKTPLLAGKLKHVEAEEEVGDTSIDNDSESESHVEMKKNSSGCQSESLQGAKIVSVDFSSSLEEEGDWPNVSSILLNPEFRFSNSSGIAKRNFCYLRQSYLYGDSKGKSDGEENEVFRYRLDYSVCKNSKLDLNFVSKEIIQES